MLSHTVTKPQHIYICFFLQAELCAIEELKLLQVQKHINLSLKLIRDLPSAKLANPPSQLAKEVIMVRRNRKENNYDGELIGIDQNQAFNRALPRRLNRAEIKLEAARVGHIISTVFLFVFLGVT